MVPRDVTRNDGVASHRLGDAGVSCGLFRPRTWQGREKPVGVDGRAPGMMVLIRLHLRTYALRECQSVSNALSQNGNQILSTVCKRLSSQR